MSHFAEEGDKVRRRGSLSKSRGWRTAAPSNSTYATYARESEGSAARVSSHSDRVQKILRKRCEGLGPLSRYDWGDKPVASLAGPAEPPEWTLLDPDHDLYG